MIRFVRRRFLRRRERISKHMVRSPSNMGIRGSYTCRGRSLAHGRSKRSESSESRRSSRGFLVLDTFSVSVRARSGSRGPFFWWAHNKLYWGPRNQAASELFSCKDKLGLDRLVEKRRPPSVSLARSLVSYTTLSLCLSTLVFSFSDEAKDKGLLNGLGHNQLMSRALAYILPSLPSLMNDSAGPWSRTTSMH